MHRESAEAHSPRAGNTDITTLLSASQMPSWKEQEKKKFGVMERIGDVIEVMGNHSCN